MKPFLLIVMTLTALSCKGYEQKSMVHDFSKLKSIPQKNWDILAKKKIFFGHQSVGYNIIDGIKDLMKRNPEIKLNIKETNNPNDFSEPVFAHSRIGKNYDPYSKIKAFEHYLDNGIGEKVDIAFFKFCYVDFSNKTNIQNLFKNYKNTLSKLKMKYPHIIFIHVTSPLTIKKSWISLLISKIKGFIKHIIGKPVYNPSLRDDFNHMLRQEYLEKELLFDLAEKEALKKVVNETVSNDKNKRFFLLPDFTDDGGHLNEFGRSIIAEQLLIFLSTKI